MRYEGIKVGLAKIVIECDDQGRMEYIDGTPIGDINEEEIQQCAIALSRHMRNQGYINSQDISMIDDREAYKSEQDIDERRGK